MCSERHNEYSESLRMYSERHNEYSERRNEYSERLRIYSECVFGLSVSKLVKLLRFSGLAARERHLKRSA